MTDAAIDTELDDELDAEGAEVGNDDRGEHELTLGRKTYALRPSYQACRRIEKKSGLTLLQLVQGGNHCALTIDTLGIVAGELIRAGASKDGLTGHVSNDRIAELIFKQGLPGVTARLTLCLMDAATGGRDPSGEAKAVPETAGSDTAS